MQAPPGQILGPLLLFHYVSVLLTSAVGDGKIVGDLYPISAQRVYGKMKTMTRMNPLNK